MKAIKLHKNQGLLFEIVNNCYVYFEYKINNFSGSIKKSLNDIKKSDDFKSKKHGLLIKLGKYISSKRSELRKVEINDGYKSLKYKNIMSELKELSKLKKIAQSFEMQPKFQREVIEDKIITTMWF